MLDIFIKLYFFTVILGLLILVYETEKALK